MSKTYMVLVKSYDCIICHILPNFLFCQCMLCHYHWNLPHKGDNLRLWSMSLQLGTKRWLRKKDINSWCYQLSKPWIYRATSYLIIKCQFIQIFKQYYILTNPYLKVFECHIYSVIKLNNEELIEFIWYVENTQTGKILFSLNIF